jgi:hypothetical protein
LTGENLQLNTGVTTFVSDGTVWVLSIATLRNGLSILSVQKLLKKLATQERISLMFTTKALVTSSQVEYQFAKINNLLSA